MCPRTQLEPASRRASVLVLAGALSVCAAPLSAASATSQTYTKDLQSISVTALAGGAGWGRTSVAGLSFPDFTLDGVAVPANRYLVVQGSQGIANLDLKAAMGLDVPPFNDKLKQMLAADAARVAMDEDRVYILHEASLILALSRDMLINPDLYASAEISSYIYDNLLVHCASVNGDPHCDVRMASDGADGGGGCPLYAEDNFALPVSAWVPPINLTTGPFHTQGPLTSAYDGALDFSLFMGSSMDRTQGARASATITIHYGSVFCVPVWFRPVSIRVTGDAAVEALLNVNGTVKSDISKTFDSTEVPWLTIPVFLVPFSVGPVPFLLFGEFLPEVGVTTTLASGPPVQLSGGVGGGLGVSFDYTCRISSGSCAGQSTRGTPQALPDASLSSNLDTNGRASIRPYAWPNLRTTLIPSGVYVKLGPRIAANFDVWGQTGNCGDADQDGHEEYTQALTMDVDVPIVELAVGVGIYDTIVSKEFVLATVLQSHFGFYDLETGGSSALSPMVSGPTTVPTGFGSTYEVRMRPCYPYSDRLAYDVEWGDGTYGQTAQGNPQIPMSVAKVWTVPGTASITVRPETDRHQRELGNIAAAVTRRNVSVTSPVCGDGICSRELQAEDELYCPADCGGPVFLPILSSGDTYFLHRSGTAMDARGTLFGGGSALEIIDLNGGSLNSGDTVCILTDNGTFAYRTPPGVSTTPEGLLQAAASACTAGATFVINRVAFGASRGWSTQSGPIRRGEQVAFSRTLSNKTTGTSTTYWIKAVGGGGSSVNVTDTALSTYAVWRLE